MGRHVSVVAAESELVNAGISAKIRAFLDGWNERSHPFVWTKTAEEILNKANRPTTSNPRH